MMEKTPQKKTKIRKKKGLSPQRVMVETPPRKGDYPPGGAPPLWAFCGAPHKEKVGTPYNGPPPIGGNPKKRGKQRGTQKGNPKKGQKKSWRQPKWGRTPQKKKGEKMGGTPLATPAIGNPKCPIRENLWKTQFAPRVGGWELVCTKKMGPENPAQKGV